MPLNDRYRLIVELVRRLNESDSWTGSTHLQKCIFFFQYLFKVPMGYRFVIYHYGPFSFELDEELALLRIRGWLEISPEPGYGVHYRPGKEAPNIESGTVCNHEDELNIVARLLGGLSVKQVELLATTYYVVNGLDGRERDLNTAFQKIHQLKPHFKEGEIEEGYRQLEELIMAGK